MRAPSLCAKSSLWQPRLGWRGVGAWRGAVRLLIGQRGSPASAEELDKGASGSAASADAGAVEDEGGGKDRGRGAEMSTLGWWRRRAPGAWVR